MIWALECGFLLVVSHFSVKMEFQVLVQISPVPLMMQGSIMFCHITFFAVCVCRILTAKNVMLQNMELFSDIKKFQ